MRKLYAKITVQSPLASRLSPLASRTLPLALCLLPLIAGADERPAWLPQEFKTPEELAAAYQKLQTEHTAPVAHAAAPVAESRLLGVNEDSKSAQKDFSVSVGTKVWVNRWETEMLTESFSASNSAGYVVSYDKDSNTSVPMTENPTPIPMATIRYKSLFVTGSYYTPTKFNVQKNTRIDLYDSVGKPIASGNQQLQGNVERSEWDISVGWLIFPNLAITSGYKEINMQGQFNGIDAFDSSLNSVVNVSNVISGATIGLAGSIPLTHLLNGTLGLYASYAHGFLSSNLNKTRSFPGANFSSTKSAKNLDTDYDVLEGGVTYTLGKESLPAYLPLSSSSIFAGYRMQWIDTQESRDDAGFGSGRSDITQGFVSGINLAF